MSFSLAKNKINENHKYEDLLTSIIIMLWILEKWS